MKEETAAKVAAELAEWDMPAPADWHGFKHALSDKIIDDRREIFVCTDDEKHLAVTAYFHEETHEYKLRIKVGLNELVRIEFIAGNLADFTERLKIYFEPLLKELSEINRTPIPPLLAEKGIGEWDFHEILPKNLAGFTLFIAPNAPFPVANGSYSVLDYTAFAADSNFAVYFNVFRDEFFGESRIAGVPTVTYEFDAKNLSQLEMLLKSKLSRHLQAIKEEVST